MASSPSRRTSEEQKGEKLTEDLKIFHQFCEENVRSVCQTHVKKYKPDMDHEMCHSFMH